MAIDFPTYEELVDRTRADVARDLPGVDPTIFGTFVRAFADSLAGRAFDIVQLQKQMLEQFFPQTASGEYLERWAAYEGLSRLAPTASDGLVTFTGTAGSTILINTQVTSTDGNSYETQGALVLASVVLSITTLTRSGTTATATVASHDLATGVELVIAGANEAAYNGTFQVTVLSSTQFTYTMDTTPSTSPAAGTITGTYAGGEIEVESVLTGEDKNLDSGSQLTLITPIAGVDAIAYVQLLGLEGATDEETDTDLLTRVLQSRTTPVANFNIGAIEKASFGVAGVTRVWVQPVTPAVGEVTIYFMRDNDVDPIPSAAEITDVEDAILELLPAQMDSGDVTVDAPTAVPTAYTFSALSPDTTTMRIAIEANLAAFYQDDVDLEVNITEDKYRSAIVNTVDPETGDFLVSFTLSTPTTDITITTSEIGTLGTVTFP